MHESPPITVQSLRIITIALAAGVALFAAVAAGVGPVTPPDPERAALSPMLLGVVAALALSGLVVSTLLGRSTQAKLAARREAALAELDSGKVPPELGAYTIVRAALGEAIGMFGCVIYLLEGDSLALFAIGFGIAWVSTSVPSLEQLRTRVKEAGRPTY